LIERLISLAIKLVLRKKPEAMHEYGFSDENQSAIFFDFYRTGYDEGYSKRIKLEQKTVGELGENPLDDEKKIFDRYLKQLVESYFGASHLFGSWSERVTNELFPQETADKSALKDIQDSILDIAKSGKTQKALRYLKVLSIDEPNAFVYYQTLSIDAELMKMRFEIKSREVDRALMRVKRQKIESKVNNLIQTLISKYKS